ncbi:hypothetical protein [Sediminibacillus massiliensis]|uniref:hypothetical protein n=1 Tax=Sediminibacillus massiliensis TaxID=1926277 RepID=UPI00098830FE|nr:hypothetical protein [Sediminibacillus massiliensis]
MINIKKKDFFQDVRQIIEDLKHSDRATVRRTEQNREDKPSEKVEYQMRARTIESIVKEENKKKSRGRSY